MKAPRLYPCEDGQRCARHAHRGVAPGDVVIFVEGCVACAKIPPAERVKQIRHHKAFALRAARRQQQERARLASSGGGS